MGVCYSIFPAVLVSLVVTAHVQDILAFDVLVGRFF